MSDLTSWREFLDARILQEKGRDEDALVILERLCDAFPRNPAFLRAKAYSLSAVNREEDAASSVVAAHYSEMAQKFRGAEDRPENWIPFLQKLQKMTDVSADSRIATSVVAW